jgi:hypothetical protein
MSKECILFLGHSVLVLYCVLNERAVSYTVQDCKFAAPAGAFINMLLYAAAVSELKQTLPIEAVKQVVYFIIKNSPTF